MCTVALLQLCPALYDPIDCSLPGSSVHEILQARILEWVARSPGDLSTLSDVPVNPDTSLKSGTLMMPFLTVIPASLRNEESIMAL